MESLFTEIPVGNLLPWIADARHAGQSGIAGWFSNVRRACGRFEWITFAYIAWLDALVLIFHSNIAHPLRHLAIQCAIAFAIALLARAARNSRSGALYFTRHWYPLPLYVFFFEELQGLVHAIFPMWFDAHLIAFDHALFGVHPSVWLAQFASPALSDFMQFSYMTYFLYLVILPALLYANREYARFWTVMASTALAHYSVYVISVLVPIESPYYSLASLNRSVLSGGYCTALIGVVERFGRVHGAAFPSAHVAGSMVAILASWRYRRWLFWLCLPFFVSMCVATVYGRYHYAADVFAGLIVGTIGFRVCVATEKSVQRGL
jgi:membrane-associated phospholipid phosphatase